MERFLADVILCVHVAFAAYNVLGLAVIWIGRALGRRFVHNPWFRLSHLAAMGAVVLEALVGMVCPLTEWEYGLRAASGEPGRYDQGFLQYWAERLFYFDWSPAVFTWLYAGFFGLMVLTAFLVPIRFRRSGP